MQGALFGAAHAYQNLLGIAITGTLGILMGLLVLASGCNLWAVIIGHGLFDASRFVLFYFQGLPTGSGQSCLLAITASNRQTGLSASRPAFLIVTDSRGANRIDSRPAC
jgi:hypothetical protein